MVLSHFIIDSVLLRHLLNFMSYVDGYVLPVKAKGKRAYQKLAKGAGKIWREHGALQYFECWGEDVKAPMCRSFPDLVKPKKGETIVFAFVIYKSRKHRDQVNAKVMKDPRMCPSGWDSKKMPFDCKRMAYGGFETIVEE